MVSNRVSKSGRNVGKQKKAKIEEITAVENTPEVIPPKVKVGILYFVIKPGESIDEKHVSLVRNAVSASTVDKLYLVVDSSGGVPYPAVRIMRLLRRRFKEILGIVPHRAMSAATLMLLGTNAIYMSEESQLGPLDLPMEHPIDGSTISALDVVQSLTQLESSSMEFATETYKELRDGTMGEKIGKDKAIKIAFKHAENMVMPLLEKIDPYHRQRAMRKLKIGRWYAIDLLQEAMMKGKRSWAELSASRFVTMFPDHSYSIFREDARLCLLEIIDSEKLAIWQYLLDETDKLVGAKISKIIYNEVEI